MKTEIRNLGDLEVEYYKMLSVSERKSLKGFKIKSVGIHSVLGVRIGSTIEFVKKRGGGE